MLVDTSASKWVRKARLPCWPSRGRQVLHQWGIWGRAYTWESMQVRDPPWLWKPGQASPEVHNRSISGHKKGHMTSKKCLKKENEVRLLRQWQRLVWRSFDDKISVNFVLLPNLLVIHFYSWDVFTKNESPQMSYFGHVPFLAETEKSGSIRKVKLDFTVRLLIM